MEVLCGYRLTLLANGTISPSKMFCHLCMYVCVFVCVIVFGVNVDVLSICSFCFSRAGFRTELKSAPM